MAYGRGGSERGCGGRERTEGWIRAKKPTKQHEVWVVVSQKEDVTVNRSFTI